MSDVEKVLLAIFGGGITLAIVSVVLSPQAQTTSVIGATGDLVSGIIRSATSPVTGSGGGSGGSGGHSFGSALDNASSLVNSASGLFSSAGINFFGG